MIFFLFLRILSKQTDLTLKRNAVWCLSNLCRGRNPPVEFSKVEPALSILALLLDNEDEDILADACCALSHLSGDLTKLQKIIESNECPRLVELLNHSSLKVVHAALRAVGNIVNGDDEQTQVIVDCNTLECLLELLNSPSESIRKEACMVIGNIAVGNIARIQVVHKFQFLIEFFFIVQYFFNIKYRLY